MFVYRIYFHVCILITAHFSFDAKIIFCHAVKSQEAFIYLLLSGMKVAKKNRHSFKQERKKTDGAKIYSNWLKQNRDVHIFIEYQSKSWFWWNYEKIVLEYMIFLWIYRLFDSLTNGTIWLTATLVIYSPTEVRKWFYGLSWWAKWTDYHPLLHGGFPFLFLLFLFIYVITGF